MSAPQATEPKHTGKTASVELRHEFASRLPELSVPWQSLVPDDPQLLALSQARAHELGLDSAWLSTKAGIRFLLGNELPTSAQPVAQLYAGHQFGAFVPRLGDGRALLLGELRTPHGDTVDLHLKGSGRTPFARADGFAALGPMLLEMLMGETMHALGIPTTRALAVVGTGLRVQREELHPGAVLVRTASSHLRVGSFQYALALGDTELLGRIAAYAIERHAPEAAHTAQPALELLRTVVHRHAKLTAQWVLVGFVHGVMNTDNVTISGETIDYGPCAFIDTYRPDAVFSSIDHSGRYALGNQPRMALWNLTRFAETLLPLIDAQQAEGNASSVSGASSVSAEPSHGTAPSSNTENEGGAAFSETAIAATREVLAEFTQAYDQAWSSGMRTKLGLSPQVDDAVITSLAAEVLEALAAHRVDYTGFFRALTRAAQGTTPSDTAVLEELLPPSGRSWVSRWRELHPDAELMARSNPIYIPRGHLVTHALSAAEEGDLGAFERLLDAVTHPFSERADYADLAQPAPSGSGPYRTTCGT